MKTFDQFINEANGDPEDKVNKILDKKGKKKLTKEEKTKIVDLSKKIKTKKPIAILPPKPVDMRDHEINLTDKVEYINPRSKHNKKEGVVMRIRKDGKVIIRFDDGSRLAANPLHVIKQKITKAMKAIDPYNEEDW